jgi:hypothetical protein
MNEWIFPTGKVAGAWCWLLTPIERRSQRRSRGTHLLFLYAFMACCRVNFTYHIISYIIYHIIYHIISYHINDTNLPLDKTWKDLLTGYKKYRISDFHISVSVLDIIYTPHAKFLISYSETAPYYSVSLTFARISDVFRACYCTPLRILLLTLVMFS